MNLAAIDTVGLTVFQKWQLLMNNQDIIPSLFVLLRDDITPRDPKQSTR